MRAILAAAAVFTIAAAPAPTAHLTSFGTIEGEIANARTLTISAYTLSPNQAVVRDLHDAVTRGASVTVALTGQGFGYALDQNHAVVAYLRNCPPVAPTCAGPPNLHVHLTAFPIHMKALVVDGTRVFVTDRNWARDGLVLAVPVSLRLTVERAILNEPTNTPAFTTTKGASLIAEAEAIGSSTGPLILATENFGFNTPLDRVIQSRIARHLPMLLVVAAKEYDENSREREQIASLPRSIITVRVCDTNDKYALTPTSAFASSSNISPGLESQIEWGYTTHDPNLIHALTRYAASVLSPQHCRSAG